MKKLIIPLIITLLFLTGCSGTNLETSAPKNPETNVEPTSVVQTTPTREATSEIVTSGTETSESSASLTDVEWLTYSDKNISFQYPKTFAGTSLHEDGDEDARGSKWMVKNDGDTVSISPNFESPAAEFGSTYEVQVLKNSKDIQEKTKSLSEDSGTPSKNLCVDLQDIKAPEGYSLCKYESPVDEELGRVGTYYMLKPSISGKPWIFVFAQTDLYLKSYVEKVLLAEMQIK